MWTPRNMKLASHSASVPLIWMWLCLSEVHNELFGLLGAEGKVAVSPPCHKVPNLLTVGQLIIVVDEAIHPCFFCKLDIDIGTMYSDSLDALPHPFGVLTFVVTKSFECLELFLLKTMTD